MPINTEPIPTSVESIPEANVLIDRHERVFDYLRIAVNEQCNLRCIYCMPEEGIDFLPTRQLLTTDEILRVIRLVSGLGVSKIRFTGGEPLLYTGITQLIKKTVQMPGITSVHLTTNGLLLKNKAADLKSAGLNGINVSLDTLNSEKYIKITRRNCLAQVLESFNKLMEINFPSVKINVVALRGFNDDELTEFVELTRDNPITVRFIELMPFDAHQIWKTGKFYQAQHIVDDLRKHFPEIIQVYEGSKTENKIFRVPGYLGKVAVIPSYSRDICGTCNRVRLTADGSIRNCLYAHTEYSVRDLLRNSGSDWDIANLFKKAMWKKVIDGWKAQKLGEEQRESMTQIGG